MKREILISSLLFASILNNTISAQEKKDSLQTKDKTVHLKEVVLTGNSFTKQIAKIDLKKIPVNTSQDLLRKVPGLFIAQHAGGGKAEQLFLRGFDSDHGTDVAVYADGMPVNIVSHAHGQGYSDLHFIIPETVDNIDFGKGSYYAEKGDFNTAGYVDFHTYNSIKNSMVKMEIGSFNTKRLYTQLNLINNEEARRYAYIASEYNYTDGPFDVKQDFNRVNVFGKYNEWISDHQYLNLQFSVFNSSWNASGQIPTRAVEKGIIGRFGSIDPTEGGSTSRINAMLQYKHSLSSGEYLESNLWYSRYKFNLYSNFTFFLENPDKGDEIQQTDGRNIFGGESKWIKNNENTTWTAGAGFRHDDIFTLQLNRVYQRKELLGKLSDVFGKETNLHSYINFLWKNNNWTINPSLRADYFIFNLQDQLHNDLPVAKSESKGILSPKLDLSYQPNLSTLWFLKSGMGFHSNDIRVVIAQDGKEILPYSIGADFGVRLKPTQSLIITPSLWYTYLQQEFVYVGDEAVVEPSGSTRRLGMDLGIRYQPNEQLYLNADISYANAKFTDEPEGENLIPLAPVWVSTGGIGWDFLNGFSANLQYRMMGENPAVEDNSIKTKSYFVNDLLLSYEKDRWGTSMQIQNLFNVKWNEAQFATETQLRGEPQSITDLAYTPGTPFFIKGSVYFKF
ncbi:TonB-dependent receptor [Riemerella columbina]|uniref:TonB-dependent receptor n=1 Tax=Riemerella columbina TaxID=103810 RepID=UPI00036B9290|nr:TonB-dependent receptor plug domain-containing protein [Riemerella columbina]